MTACGPDSGRNPSSTCGNKNKKMKSIKNIKTVKACCALIGAATVLTAPNLFASFDGTVTLSFDGGNAFNGGAFKAVTSGLGTFDTFCLDKDTDFNIGQTYQYAISSTILPGGSFITLGTAYIYSQFTAGAAGYSGSSAMDNEIQQAIWWLQGDIAIRPTIINQLETDLSTTDQGLEVNGNGAYGVVALALTPLGGGAYAQPQLAVVPEPTTILAGVMLVGSSEHRTTSPQLKPGAVT